MLNIVITGTSRGIGLELTRVAQGLGHRVLAVARQTSAAKELNTLVSSSQGKIEMLDLDLTQPQAPEKLAHALKAWGHVDIFINNAGIYCQGESAENFMKSFQINSVVPFFLTQAILPFLKKAKAPIAAYLSSQMGSITDNASGGAYSYRASKTALNMIIKSLSVDESWLKCLVLHPGWVQTDMGGTNAPVKVQDSAAGLWQLIAESENKQSGHFYNFRGEELPW